MLVSYNTALKGQQSLNFLNFIYYKWFWPKQVQQQHCTPLLPHHHPAHWQQLLCWRLLTPLSQAPHKTLDYHWSAGDWWGGSSYSTWHLTSTQQSLWHHPGYETKWTLIELSKAQRPEAQTRKLDMIQNGARQWEALFSTDYFLCKLNALVLIISWAIVYLSIRTHTSLFTCFKL